MTNTERINRAAMRMNDAIEHYVNVCREHEPAVRRIVVTTYKDGSYEKTTVHSRRVKI